MHPYPKHLPAFDYIGPHRYFVTACTHERRPLFTTPAHVALVEEHFLRTATELAFVDLAHCFMPDHCHALLEGTHDACDLRAFIKRWKQFSGFYFKQQYGTQLWQRYSHERVLRDDEATPRVVRYILENPIRAGLVRSAVEYPFIGSSVYSREQLLDFCS